jgi:Tfp pilus assembly protein PilN
MIEINLLPEERRPVERTPIPRLITILVGVFLVCIEGVLFIYFHSRLGPMRSVLRNIGFDLTQVLKDVETVQQIRQEIGEFAKRKADIQKLTHDRRLWAPILNRLCDPELLPDMVWYRKVSVQKGKAARRGEVAPDELVVEAYARGEDGYSMRRTANEFLKNLQKPHAGFSEHFEGRPTTDAFDIKKMPRGRTARPDVPEEAVAFQVRMQLSPTGTAKKSSK